MKAQRDFFYCQGLDSRFLNVIEFSRASILKPPQYMFDHLCLYLTKNVGPENRLWKHSRNVCVELRWGCPMFLEPQLTKSSLQYKTAYNTKKSITSWKYIGLHINYITSTAIENERRNAKLKNENLEPHRSTSVHHCSKYFKEQGRWSTWKLLF